MIELELEGVDEVTVGLIGAEEGIPFEILCASGDFAIFRGESGFTAFDGPAIEGITFYKIDEASLLEGGV